MNFNISNIIGKCKFCLSDIVDFGKLLPIVGLIPGRGTPGLSGHSLSMVLTRGGGWPGTCLPAPAARPGWGAPILARRAGLGWSGNSEEPWSETMK